MSIPFVLSQRNCRPLLVGALRSKTTCLATFLIWHSRRKKLTLREEKVEWIARSSRFKAKGSAS